MINSALSRKLSFKRPDFAGCPAWKLPILLLAIGLGTGLLPASGTAGALLGVPLTLALPWLGLSSAWSRAVACLVLSLAAVPLCEIAERHYGRKDDGRIVADEYLTFPIVMLGLPHAPVVFMVAFLTSRFFDIVKPPPARQLQEVRGGLGIVADDVVACLFSLLTNHAILYFMGPFFRQKGWLP